MKNLLYGNSKLLSKVLVINDAMKTLRICLINQQLRQWIEENKYDFRWEIV